MPTSRSAPPATHLDQSRPIKVLVAVGFVLAVCVIPPLRQVAMSLLDWIGTSLAHLFSRSLPKAPTPATTP
jgi:hypothetical protein